MHRIRSKSARGAAFVVLFCAPVSALAQYKCTSANGSITFQQTPCPPAAEEAKIRIFSAPATPASAGTARAPGAGTVEQRMVKSMERDRNIAAVERDIAATENDIDNRSRTMAAEIDALRRRKQFANNNLAGATYEQSLSSEMQAVAAKYKAMNDVDLQRVKELRRTLAALRATEPRTE